LTWNRNTQEFSGALFLLAALAIASSAIRAETIRIRTLDGRNGRPIPNENLQVWIDRQSGAALNLSMHKDGVADLEVSRDSVIFVNSNYYFDCRFTRTADPSNSAYAVSEILKSGIVSTNACGKLNVEVRPGEFIFFVRPAHWWEGLRR
jgi:hypothetical protein